MFTCVIFDLIFKFVWSETLKCDKHAKKKKIRMHENDSLLCTKTPQVQISYNMLSEFCQCQYFEWSDSVSTVLSCVKWMYLLIISQLETEDNTSLKIMDALVGHLHQIQIRAQDALINHSQWSEWSHVVEARPWIGERTHTTHTHTHTTHTHTGFHVFYRDIP